MVEEAGGLIVWTGSILEELVEVGVGGTAEEEIVTGVEEEIVTGVEETMIGVVGTIPGVDEMVGREDKVIGGMTGDLIGRNLIGRDSSSFSGFSDSQV